MCIATSNSTRRATTCDPRLLRLYRLTRYRAAGCDIRIGRRTPDVLFGRLGARQAILLTAWNPMSRRMPDGWNRRMQRRLRERLRHHAVVEADGSLRWWREEMLLVGGPSRPATVLARRFRQHAVVTLRRNMRARLVLVVSPCTR